MDNLALSVSKSITDFLEQNEKRFVSQNSVQEQHTQLLTDLQAKISQLEKKCDELVTENTSLKSELDTLKQREESTTKDMILAKSDLERMQKDVKDCSEWMNLMAELTQQVQDLRIVRDLTKRQIDDISKNQSNLKKQIDVISENQANLADRVNRQGRQIKATAQAAAAAAAPTPNLNAPHYNIINSTPIRSPSTSSFFNSNMGSHSSMQARYKNHANNSHHNSNYLHEDYIAPSEAYDEVCDNAAFLVKELHDIHKSFEKGSNCSD